jgi:hypothetical protein
MEMTQKQEQEQRTANMGFCASAAGQTSINMHSPTSVQAGQTTLNFGSNFNKIIKSAAVMDRRYSNSTPAQSPVRCASCSPCTEESRN